MRLRNVFRPMSVLAVAAALALPIVAQAQEQETVEPAPDTQPTDAPAEHFWIGLMCHPVEPPLRAQLGLAEGEGLVVGHVMPEGPAATAGIEMHDVLTKAGEAKLTSLADLSRAVQQAGSQDQTVTIELLRRGEMMTVEVQPEARPAPSGRMARRMPDEIDVWRWLDRTLPGVVPERGRPPLNLRLFRPGQPMHLELPADVNITINKQGDQPTKITVKKGDESWEVTEETLSELPETIRGYVDLLMGWIPAGAQVRMLTPEAERAMRRGEQYLRDQQRDLRQRGERVQRDLEAESREYYKKFEERLDNLQRMLEDLRKQIQSDPDQT